MCIHCFSIAFSIWFQVKTLYTHHSISENRTKLESIKATIGQQDNTSEPVSLVLVTFRTQLHARSPKHCNYYFSPARIPFIPMDALLLGRIFAFRGQETTFYIYIYKEYTIQHMMVNSRTALMESKRDTIIIAHSTARQKLRNSGEIETNCALGHSAVRLVSARVWVFLLLLWCWVRLIRCLLPSLIMCIIC